MTPLHKAACHSFGAEVVELLLARRAAVDAADARGRTPLHEAADMHELAHVDDVIPTLEALKARGADLDAVTRDGETALMLAQAIARNRKIAPRDMGFSSY